jgi:hypothetical protein
MQPQLTTDQIEQLTPEQLVNKLWDKRIRNRVIRTLVGGLSSTELKTQARLSPAAREALINGLDHWSPVVRWWCLQLIDHLADESLLHHVAPLLDDPVPRVRKQAEHTLTCEGCKQNSDVVMAGRKLLEERVSLN